MRRAEEYSAIIKLENTKCGGLPIYTNGSKADRVTKYYLTRKYLPFWEHNRNEDQRSVRTKRYEDKGIVVGGKVHDKEQSDHCAVSAA